MFRHGQGVTGPEAAKALERALGCDSELWINGRLVETCTGQNGVAKVREFSFPPSCRVFRAGDVGALSVLRTAKNEIPT
jgi:hypothetical protein